MQLTLDLRPDRLAVCRLAPEQRVPAWAQGPLVSVTRSEAELSIVCAEDRVPDHVDSEPGWRVLSVRGPLAFSMTGVLAALAAPLAEAGVAIFVVSTYDTDHLLVPDRQLAEAVGALERAGHRVAGD